MRRLRKPNWLSTLYVALAALYVVPLWSVRYMPMVDGPSHLYNASILLKLITGTGGRLAQIYQIDWHPLPNWLGHVVLAALLPVFPAYIAEKLFVTAILAFFFAGAWSFARARDERCTAYAFLAFPLAYDQSLQFGYYNFSLGVGLFLLTVSLWWRNREDTSWSNVARFAALLLLMYFCHPMPTGLAMGSIGLMWLITSRKVRHLVAFVPATLLLVWYFSTQSATESHPPLHDLADFLTHARFLLTFDERQITFGVALFVLYVLLAVATIAIDRTREGRVFGAILAAFLILYFIAPKAAAGGLGVNDRIGFFLYLLPVAWFTPSLPRPVRTTFIALMSIVAIANAVFLTQHYHRADRVLREIVRTFDPAPPQKTFIALLYDNRPPGSPLGLMSHAADYAAVERNLIDVANYEAEIGYFPIRYKPGVPFLYSGQIDLTKPAQFADRAELLFTWKMPPGAQPEIEQRYRLSNEWGLGRLYIRK